MGWTSHLEDDVDKCDGAEPPVIRAPSDRNLLNWDGRSTASRAAPVKCFYCDMAIHPFEMKSHIRTVHGTTAFDLLPMRRILSNLITKLKQQRKT